MLSTLFTFAQDFSNPIDYLNYWEKSNNLLQEALGYKTPAVAHSTNARRIETTRKQLVNSIKNSSKKIEALKNGYKGDIEFRI